MMPILSQNKISGMSIACGKGSWDDEAQAYMFDGDGSYELKVDESFLADHGITEDDLIDCVAQIEERFGSPDDTRMSLGLFKNSGASNIGETAISRSNPSIMCVFTPMSSEGGAVDGYFEWFYNKTTSSEVGLDDYLNTFVMKSEEPTSEPVTMPSYGEALEYLFNRTDLSESVKDKFLAGLWHHDRTKAQGFKNSLREELLPQWAKFKKK